MPSYSELSYSRLNTCDVRLQSIFMEVIKTIDCTILEGERSEERQRKNIEKGVSKTMDSKHLLRPSKAVDVAPYPLKWPKPPKDDSVAERTRWMKEYAMFYLFAGYVLRVAEEKGIKIRWGGDWNGNFQVDDQSFDDLVHFELIS